MNKHWIALLTCVTGFAHCEAADLKSNTPHELTAEETAAIQQGVQESLKDPDSARFSSLSGATMDGGTIAACGLVNAKNSFGGYTGKSPFMGLLMKGTYESKFAVISIGSGESEETVTRLMCEKNNITLP